MTDLRLELLGDLQIRSDQGTLINIGARKSQALLAYLGVKPSQRVSREKLALLLWSSTGPDQARQSLRQTLSTLRKELAAISDQKILVEEGDLLGLDESFITCDVPAFDLLITSGTEAALGEAIALYHGDFLDGFSLNEERFDQWTLAERDRLHRSALRAHTTLMEMQIKRGDNDGAAGTAQSALRLDILQEPVHRALMRLYLQSGDVVNALQQYETCAKVLKRELRIEPGPETKALQREILQVRAKSSVTPGRSEKSRQPAILVVEDNVLNRELNNAVLKAAGYSVLLAKDGAEALMLLGREEIDLVLLDIDLPFINGHDLLRAIRENGMNVPAIFVSGLPGDEVEVQAFEIGAADFIHKPVKNQVLLARVAKVLGES